MVILLNKHVIKNFTFFNGKRSFVNNILRLEYLFVFSHF